MTHKLHPLDRTPRATKPSIQAGARCHPVSCDGGGFAWTKNSQQWKNCCSDPVLPSPPSRGTRCWWPFVVYSCFSIGERYDSDSWSRRNCCFLERGCGWRCHCHCYHCAFEEHHWAGTVKDSCSDFRWVPPQSKEDNHVDHCSSVEHRLAGNGTDFLMVFSPL